MIPRRNARGIASQLAYVIEHYFVLLRNRRGLVILLQRSHQLVIQGNSTQKLCVGFDSIVAAISNGNDGGDHLVLSSGERKVRRHQYAEGGKRVMKRLWDQAVRSDDMRRLAIGCGMNRHCILCWIQFTLRFNGATELLITFRDGYGLNPGHKMVSLFILPTFRQTDLFERGPIAT